MNSESSLNAALRQFEVAQANLSKLERIWNEIKDMIPSGIVFGADELYETKLRSYKHLVDSLPKVLGYKPETIPMNLDEIAQSRLDANEIGDFEALMYVEREIDVPRLELQEYKFRLQDLRKTLVRNAVSELVDRIDEVLGKLSARYQIDELDEDLPVWQALPHDLDWEFLRDFVDEFNSLLGDSVDRPKRWSDLLRHLRFGKMCDLIDIVKTDWPMIKTSVWTALSNEDDPIPSDISDLGDLVATKPSGPIATKLLWENISDDDFERLMFVLISSERGYENPEWLMKTRAADRGRDLSVIRVINDGLAGVTRQRVIIQCKHYLKASISADDVSLLKEQIKMWEPPRVHVLIIATSGRFTADAVALIERHNESDSVLRIEMWPESHLERVLASRPAIVGEFRLR